MDRVRAIARLIDHTLLKPEATRAQIITLCAEARDHGFASVCVNPYWVPIAARELAGSGVSVCTVCGFPLGATTSSTKAHEAGEAVAAGAREIDMVINVGALRSGDHEAVQRDIELVAAATHAGNAILKVIIEAALLEDAEKTAACTLAKAAGAEFVKTSTGFGPGGATLADVALMRAAVGPELGVKAAGGIRTLEELEAMVAAGANRIGTSSGVRIVQAIR